MPLRIEGAAHGPGSSQFLSAGSNAALINSGSPPRSNVSFFSTRIEPALPPDRSRSLMGPDSSRVRGREQIRGLFIPGTSEPLTGAMIEDAAPVSGSSAGSVSRIKPGPAWTKSAARFAGGPFARRSFTERWPAALYRTLVCLRLVYPRLHPLKKRFSERIQLLTIGSQGQAINGANPSAALEARATR